MKKNLKISDFKKCLKIKIRLFLFKNNNKIKNIRNNFNVYK